MTLLKFLLVISKVDLSLKLFLGSEKKQLSYVSMGTSQKGLAEVKKRVRSKKFR